MFGVVWIALITASPRWRAVVTDMSLALALEYGLRFGEARERICSAVRFGEVELLDSPEGRAVIFSDAAVRIRHPVVV